MQVRTQSMKKLKEQDFDLNLLSKYRNFYFGFAALIILVHHVTVKGTGTIILDMYMFARSLGAMGVDIFLLFSGIGLFYSFSKNENIMLFYYRRFMRILPAFFIICIPWYLWVDFIKEKLGFIKFLKDITLLSYWTTPNGGEWYIAAILVFYLLYPLIYRCLIGGAWRIFIPFLIWLVITTIVYFVLPELFVNANTFLSRVPIFIIGSYLGEKVKNHQKCSQKIILWMLLINIVTLAIEAYFALFGNTYTFWPRLLYAPLSVSFVILGIAIFERISFVPISRWLNKIGSCSLEIYLFNQKIVPIVCNTLIAMNIFNHTNSLIIGNILAIIATIGASYVLHIFLEKFQKSMIKTDNISMNL